MTNEDAAIHLGDHEDIRHIVIDRPERGNMLTLPMIHILGRVIREIPDHAKVVHLTSNGSDFCCGRDPQGNPEAATALEIRRTLLEPILSLYDALAGCPVPIVCSVQGAARGLGAALTAACDITIVAASARFCLPEMEKDLPPTLAMSVLKNCVSPKTLAYLVYGMAEVDAQAAFSLGLVSAVVDDDDLNAASERLLSTLTARSRPTLVAVKEYQRATVEMGPRAARDMAANLLACVLSSAGK